LLSSREQCSKSVLYSSAFGVVTDSKGNDEA
jgi:hypothetical protein